jgi:hypothetical protein
MHYFAAVTYAVVSSLLLISLRSKYSLLLLFSNSLGPRFVLFTQNGKPNFIVKQNSKLSYRTLMFLDSRRKHIQNLKSETITAVFVNVIFLC